MIIINSTYSYFTAPPICLHRLICRISPSPASQKKNTVFTSLNHFYRIRHPSCFFLYQLSPFSTQTAYTHRHHLILISTPWLVTFAYLLHTTAELKNKYVEERSTAFRNVLLLTRVWFFSFLTYIYFYIFFNCLLHIVENILTYFQSKITAKQSCRFFFTHIMNFYY